MSSTDPPGCVLPMCAGRVAHRALVDWVSTPQPEQRGRQGLSHDVAVEMTGAERVIVVIVVALGLEGCRHPLIGEPKIAIRAWAAARTQIMLTGLT
jgi:hypothetical protein